MKLADHFRIIAHSWWRIVLFSALVAAGVYAISSRQAKEYSASTFLSVSSRRSDLNGTAAKDETVFVTNTYAELAKSKPVLRQAVKSSGLRISTATAHDRISASASSDLGFLTLSARGPKPRDASELANATAKSLIADVNRQQDKADEEDLAPVRKQLDSIQKQIDAGGLDATQRTALDARYAALLQVLVQRQTQSRNRIEVVSSATTPGSPAAPHPKRDALLGFFVALVIAAEGAVALFVLGDRFSRRIDEEALTAITGLPVLASIPKASGTAIVEAFRVLRTSLLLHPAEPGTRTFAVVSANAGAGKSFTSLHLAEALAALGSDVVLVDADLRKPVIHKWLAVPRDPGLTDVLQDAHSLKALRPVEGYEHLRVLPSGRPVPDPAAVLGGRAFARLMDLLEQNDSTVIVDTPPVALVADAVPVAVQCDAAIFVVDVTTSRRRAVRSAIDGLRRAGTNLVGIVVNRTTVSRGAFYYAAAPERRGTKVQDLSG